MALQLLINNGVSDSDYTNYVVPGSLQITDQINQPTQIKFTLTNINSAFVVPKQGAYFKVFSKKFQKFLATGFITAEPVRRLLGPSKQAPSTKFQLYNYDCVGASDEWLANTKNIPIQPAFINQGKGQILGNLLNALVPNFYNTTSFAVSGDVVPFYQYDSAKTWSDMAKDLADQARYRYKVINKTFYFQPIGDAALGIAYDEDLQSESQFDAFGLASDVLIVPPVNDAIVIGDIEPQDYREDHFIGDGLTGDYALHHEAFRAATALLLQEDWTGTSLATDLWAEVDPFTTISLAGGSLNVVSPVNLLSSMNDFSSPVWTTVGIGTTAPVVSQNAALDPLNDQPVFNIAFPATAGGTFADVRQAVPGVITSGKTFAVSLWMRTLVGTALIDINIQDGTFAHAAFIQTFNVTTAWQRFTAIGTFVGGTAPGLQFIIRQDASLPAVNVLVWNAQVTATSQAQAFELNQSYMQAKNGVELGGVTYFQHGEFTFTDSGNGIIGGVYNAANSFLNKTCEFGFDVRPSASVVSSASGASGVLLQPVRFGSRIGPQVITKLNHNYVLSNYVHCQKWSRANTVYRSLAGAQFGGTNLSASGAITWTIQDYDIGQPNAAPVISVFTLDVPSLPSFGIYVPINSANLNLFENFTLISQPPQATLEVRSLYGPTGLMLPVGRPIPVPGAVAAPTVVTGSSVTGTSVPYSLSGVSVRAGIYQDLTAYTAPNGADLGVATSNTVSSVLLGSSLVFQGVTYIFGPLTLNTLVANVVDTQGQALRLSSVLLAEQPYASLRIAALAVNGAKTSQPVSVIYTDGSVDSFVQSFSDWKTSSAFSGESIALSMAYSNLSNGTKDNTTTRLYSYAFNLNTSKSVRAIQLPMCTDLLVYAMSLVPVTVIATTTTPGAVSSGAVVPGALDVEQKYVLGFGFQQQVATLQDQGDTTVLRFYPDVLPGVGSRIRLRSRAAGAAIGRVRDNTNVAATALISGDDGVRSGIFSDLKPLPRTSADAEFAASALIADREHTQFKGAYTFTDDLFATFIAPGAYNGLQASEDFSVPPWTSNSSVTVIANTSDVPDPRGYSTADKLTPLDPTNSAIWQNNGTAVVGNGKAYTGSVWLRTLSGSVTLALRLNKNVGNATFGAAQTTITVTSTWRRFFITGIDDGTATLVGLMIGGNSSWPSSASPVYAWGAQLVPGKSGIPYQSQFLDYPLPGRYLFCNAPRRGIVNQNLLVNGVVIAVDEFRDEKLTFQVSFGPDLYLDKLLSLFNSKPAGILLPQDVTTRPAIQPNTNVGTTFLPDLSDAKITNLGTAPINLFSFSEQFDPPVWTKDGGSTVTPNGAVDPNGGNTADILIKGAGPFGDLSELYQRIATSAYVGQTLTYSIWMRVTSGTANCTITVGDYLLASKFQSVVVDTTWRRFSVTGPVINNTGSIAAGVTDGRATGSQLLIWGAQLENNPSMTDYVSVGATPTITTNTIVVDSAFEPTLGTNWIEVRRADAGWGSNDQNLVSINSTRAFSLTRSTLDQTWYLRLVSSNSSGGFKTSRFSKVIRVNYPLSPSAPATVLADSRFVQLDFAGDVRNIYGIELRAGDNATVLAQRPVFGKSDMYFDLQSLPNYKTVLAFGRTLFAYFFNLQWEYSTATQVALPAPVGPVLILGNKFGSLVESRLDQLARTDINYTTFQVAQDVNFTVNVITVTGSQQPAAMSVSVPNSSGSQFFARAKRTDYFGDGSFGPVLNIPYGNIIASSWAAGQGSIPPTLDNQVTSLFTYTGTALVGGGANSGRLVVSWPTFIIAYADQTTQSVLSGTFDTSYTLTSSTSSTTPYIFYSRLVALIPGSQPQFVNGAHTSKNSADATACVADGFLSLGGSSLSLTFNVPIAPTSGSPGSGGGFDGGSGCVAINEPVYTPIGCIKAKKVVLGQLLKGCNPKTGKVYWNTVVCLDFSEEKCVLVILKDGSKCVVSRTAPMPVWRSAKGKFLGCIPAKTLTGDNFIMNLKGEKVQVKKLVDVGFKKVVMISLKPHHMFFAGHMLTHNVLPRK
jgi:hypothetical protein